MASHAAGWSFTGAYKLNGTQLDVQLENEYLFAVTGLSGISAGLGTTFQHTFPWGHALSASVDASIARASVPLPMPSAPLMASPR